MAREQLRIREGMVVLSADGEKLGKVTRVSADHLEIEKGIIFRSDREARLSDVAAVRDNDVYLSRNEAEVETLGPLESRAAKARGAGRARRPARRPRAARPWAAAPSRVPLVEEQVIAHKEVVETGEVVLRKGR